MDVQALLRDDNLDDALSALEEQVRKDPSSAELRTFLFELLCVLGDWDRALSQLQVVKDLDAQAVTLVQVYGAAIRCEAVRAEVFAGRRSPIVFGDPEPWVASMVEALGASSRGEVEASMELRRRAFEQGLDCAGAIDGAPFRWVADADVRLGPLLEAVINGRYSWVPLGSVPRIELSEPASLRDVVWARAVLHLANGGSVGALVPVRYPGSEASVDATLRLARKTEWEDRGHGLRVGHGQRVLATDERDHALLDVRTIEVQGHGDA
jgi:type VI secretion system protein ImpE